MTIDDIPERLRRQVIREHYRAMQLRATATRLAKHPPEQRQAHAMRAASQRFKTEADRKAHGALMNRASQAACARRRQGKTALQLQDERRAQKQASKQRLKLARVASIKSPKSKAAVRAPRSAKPPAVTPLMIHVDAFTAAPPTPPPPPPASTCPRCGSPSDGGLCAGCVLADAFPKHVRD
jgi:hypothetical protein